VDEVEEIITEELDRDTFVDVGIWNNFMRREKAREDVGKYFLGAAARTTTVDHLTTNSRMSRFSKYTFLSRMSADVSFRRPS
jgi:hypothetical protein